MNKKYAVTMTFTVESPRLLDEELHLPIEVKFEEGLLADCSTILDTYIVDVEELPS